MKNISFALTTEQVRNQTKTVTRRLGWKTLKPGTLLQPVVKGMGLKKGEKAEKIGGPIRVVAVTREWMSDYLNREDCIEETAREGFGHLTPYEFYEFFRRTHPDPGADDLEVTRIEFEYVYQRQTTQVGTA